MSPQRAESKIIRVFEILPEGSEKLESVEKEGVADEDLTKTNPAAEIASILNQLIKEINELENEIDIDYILNDPNSIQ